MEALVSQLEALRNQVARAMKSGDIREATAHAQMHATLRWGLPGCAVRLDEGPPTPPLVVAAPLSAGKLRHDIEQLRYLHRIKRLGPLAEDFAAKLEIVLCRVEAAGIRGQTHATEEEAERIASFYGRLVHVWEAQEVRRALSDSWDPAVVEAALSTDPMAPVVIDNFLSGEALIGLRQFCLESTIWTTNRYAHERLGSFFVDGFNCPLILQIAGELREVLPRLLWNHTLRQVWGFKYARVHPANTTHADFAAVNVNFWITPDSANLDPGSGGLLVFRIEAPTDWNFAKYNRDSGAIQSYLRSQDITALRIPYRNNRAVVFCSDLFHATDQVTFRSGYENRRINVTLLYGERAEYPRSPASGSSAS